ncbi:zona pellucida sperm-binding protein 3 receptor-like isoform X2 [Lineus longissimus]|uniref:zona pellucida sperm-binding protein 3 receptor-like isoform X2 n=1 Tax=Lineus longissimus TaxID=88925 RepID=UPI00315DC1BF
MKMSSFLTSLVLLMFTCILAQESQENLGNPKCETKPLDRKIRFKTKHGRLTEGLFTTGTVLKFRCKDGHSLTDNEGRVCFEDGWSHDAFPRCRPTQTSLENKDQDAAVAHQNINSKRVPRRAHVGHVECKDPWIRNGYISGRVERPHLEGSMVHITCMDGFVFVNSQKKDGRIYCDGVGKWSLTPEDVCVASGCRHPGNIDKGNMHFSREQAGTTQLFPFGTNVIYSCDASHTLFGGQSKRTCKLSGNGPIGVWSPHGSPVCMWVQRGIW